MSIEVTATIFHRTRENSMKVAQQISDILGKHISDDAINPITVTRTLSAAIAGQICSRTNEAASLAMFREMLNMAIEHDDIARYVPMSNWKTSRLSNDAEYDWKAACHELECFINDYGANEDDHRSIEVATALNNVLASVIFHTWADDDGFVSRDLIDDIYDEIEHAVYAAMKVERWREQNDVRTAQ